MDKEGNLFAKARFLFACINVALGTIDLKHKIYFITSNNMTHIVINISLYSSYNVYLYLINTENIIKKKKKHIFVLYYIIYIHNLWKKIIGKQTGLEVFGKRDTQKRDRSRRAEVEHPISYPIFTESSFWHVHSRPGV